MYFIVTLNISTQLNALSVHVTKQPNNVDCNYIQYTCNE